MEYIFNIGRTEQSTKQSFIRQSKHDIKMVVLVRKYNKKNIINE